MDKQEKLILVSVISDLSLFIFAILFLIIKLLLNYKKKNKVKKILNSKDFIEIIGSKKQLETNVKKYFKEIFIRDVNITLFKNFLKSETGIGKQTTKIAWDFFIILITSVLANNSQGKVSEAVQSIKNIFNESKKLLLTSDASNLVTDIILKIINLKIRPILINSRSLTEINANGEFIINDENLDNDVIKDFWNQINKVREDLIENKYLYFISILSLSNQSSEQIKNLLNYKSKYKTTEDEIKTEIKINESIIKIKEIFQNN